MGRFTKALINGEESRVSEHTKQTVESLDSGI
jgi:hypothetical protein